jgi:hypothetical protein
MNLAAAHALTLMGQPGSWAGCAGKPLRACPDGVLRQARAFFKGLEHKTARTKEQVEGIRLVLDDREAHNPQQRLAL